MNSIKILLILAVSLLLQIAFCAYFSQFSMKEPEHDPCYDSSGRSVRCIPDFINAAFGKPIIASSTCGLTSPSK